MNPAACYPFNPSDTHPLTPLLQVGHTHNHLDGTFGVVSRHVYGSQRGGTTGRDVLSFSGFDKVSDTVIFVNLCIGIN